MIAAFQRSGFQKTGFQIGDEDDLRGKVIRRRKTKVWTDEELGLTKLPKKEAKQVVVARQRLIDLLPKIQVKQVDTEPARREAARLIRKLRQNERRIRDIEDEELAMILALLD